MFIGHFALAFGAKKAAPQVSLGTAILACQFADILWPTLVLLGIERVEIDPGNTPVTPLNFISYPYSHSLVMLIAWAALFAIVYRWRRGGSIVPMTVIAGLVFSHYVLDVISHRPDMPITIGGSSKIGLGLWYHPTATLVVESAMFITGLALYAATTRAHDRIGAFSLWAFVIVLGAIYIGALFGPPPPSVTAVAFSGEGLWLFVAWAYWIDRHRTVA